MLVYQRINNYLISIEGDQNNTLSMAIPTYLSIINYLSKVKKEIVPMSIDDTTDTCDDDVDSLVSVIHTVSYKSIKEEYYTLICHYL